MKRYHYVGPLEIEQVPQQQAQRALIRQARDIPRWVKDSQQRPNIDGTITVTFIINLQEQLWIADQHSEHVRCAAGQDVLAAGEITFELRSKQVVVSAITNQSTGYCPEPESWAIVQRVLDRLQLPHPGAFTTSFIFRRCIKCSTTNIVKDEWFECAVCQAQLPKEWNYG